MENKITYDENKIKKYDIFWGSTFQKEEQQS